jgi:hypothetical protein
VTTLWSHSCADCGRTWRLGAPIIDQDGAHRDADNEPCKGMITATPVPLGRAPHVFAPEDTAGDGVIAPEGPTAA